MLASQLKRMMSNDKAPDPVDMTIGNLSIHSSYMPHSLLLLCKITKP